MEEDFDEIPDMENPKNSKPKKKNKSGGFQSFGRFYSIITFL